MKRKIITIITIAALLLGSYPTGAESIHKLTTKDQRLTTTLTTAFPATSDYMLTTNDYRLTTNLRPRAAGERTPQQEAIQRVDTAYETFLRVEAGKSLATVGVSYDDLRGISESLAAVRQVGDDERSVTSGKIGFQLNMAASRLRAMTAYQGLINLSREVGPDDIEDVETAFKARLAVIDDKLIKEDAKRLIKAAMKKLQREFAFQIGDEWGSIQEDLEGGASWTSLVQFLPVFNSAHRILIEAGVLSDEELRDFMEMRYHLQADIEKHALDEVLKRRKKTTGHRAKQVLLRKDQSVRLTHAVSGRCVEIGYAGKVKKMGFDRIAPIPMMSIDVPLGIIPVRGQELVWAEVHSRKRSWRRSPDLLRRIEYHWTAIEGNMEPPESEILWCRTTQLENPSDTRLWFFHLFTMEKIMEKEGVQLRDFITLNHCLQIRFTGISNDTSQVWFDVTDQFGLFEEPQIIKPGSESPTGVETSSGPGVIKGVRSLHFTLGQI